MMNKRKKNKNVNDLHKSTNNSNTNISSSLEEQLSASYPKSNIISDAYEENSAISQESPDLLPIRQREKINQRSKPDNIKTTQNDSGEIKLAAIRKYCDITNNPDWKRILRFYIEKNQKNLDFREIGYASVGIQDTGVNITFRWNGGKIKIDY